MSEPVPPTASTVVVVGSGPGMGLSIARAFAAAGYPVALVSRGEARLSREAKAIEIAGGRCVTVVGDAADPEALVAAVTSATLPTPIAAVVYNAAAFGGPLTTVPLNEMRRSSDVNVHSLITLTTALLPQLQAAKGSVLVTGGALALHPSAVAGMVSVGKAGLRAAVLALPMSSPRRASPWPL